MFYIKFELELTLENTLSCMKKVSLFLLFIYYSASGFCQCIEKRKIDFGGDWEFSKYQYLCPVYSFENNGDTSKQWEYTRRIDIKQVAKEVAPIKSNLERAIKRYAGNIFFSRLTFAMVDIVYPDSLKKYIERGNTNATIKYCKAKYYFFYHFNIDTNISYNVGFAVNRKGRIISKFNFPSKHQYVPIDKNMSVCKAIEIARSINKNIDPIDKMVIYYNEQLHRFYWLISQKILNIKVGENDVNQVYIDAANPKIARSQIGKARIVF